MLRTELLLKALCIFPEHTGTGPNPPKMEQECSTAAVVMLTRSRRVINRSVMESGEQGLTSDIYSFDISDIYFLTFHLYSGILPVIYYDIYSGMYVGILSGILSGGYLK